MTHGTLNMQNRMRQRHPSPKGMPEMQRFRQMHCHQLGCCEPRGQSHLYHTSHTDAEHHIRC